MDEVQVVRMLQVADGTTVSDSHEEQWAEFRLSSERLLREACRERHLYALALIALMESINSFGFQFSTGKADYKVHCFAGTVLVEQDAPRVAGDEAHDGS